MTQQGTHLSLPTYHKEHETSFFRNTITHASRKLHRHNTRHVQGTHLSLRSHHEELQHERAEVAWVVAVPKCQEHQRREVRKRLVAEEPEPFEEIPVDGSIGEDVNRNTCWRKLYLPFVLPPHPSPIRSDPIRPDPMFSSITLRAPVGTQARKIEHNTNLSVCCR